MEFWLGVLFGGFIGFITGVIIIACIKINKEE